MSTTPDPQADVPQVIIRYPNQSGALVLVGEHPAVNLGYGTPCPIYNATCAGCRDEYRNYPDTDLQPVRGWANQHAATCRALPQPEHAETTGGTA